MILGDRDPDVEIVRVRTTDDRVVDVLLEGSEIIPRATFHRQWRLLEKHDWARLCSDDAPPPYAEVTCTFAVVRGGRQFRAWGKVLETVLVEATKSGDVYRAGAEQRVVKLAAEMAATLESLAELDAAFGPEQAQKSPEQAPVEDSEIVTSGEMRWMWIVLGLLGVLVALVVWRVAI